MIFSNSRCLGLTSTVVSDSPVMLPPGRARLATKPLSTGPARGGEHDGNAAGGALRRLGRGRPMRRDDFDFRPHQLGGEAGRRSALLSAKRHSMSKFFPST